MYFMPFIYTNSDTKVEENLFKTLVPENCPILFTFFQKTNFEPTKDDPLMNNFPLNLVH